MLEAFTKGLLMSDTHVPENFDLLVRQAGYLPTVEALAACRFIGVQLQGIPKGYRELSVARLRNKAKALTKEGIAPEMVLMIDALCDGWSDFSMPE
jgi:hypothetical protein